MISLGDVAKVQAGQAAPKEFGNEGYPFIRAGHLEGLLQGEPLTDLPKVSNEVASKKRLKLLPEGSILFAKSGMSATKNRVYITDRKAYFVSHLAAINPNDDLDTNYLAYYLSWFNPARLIIDEAYPSIRLSEINMLKIPLPPLEEQKKIAAILDAADGLRQKDAQLIAKYNALSQSLFLDMFGDPVTNPMGWDKASVAKATSDGLIEEIQDGNHGEKHPKTADFSADGIPFIMANCMQGGELLLTKAYKLPHEWTTKLRIGFAQGGDVLLSHKGTVGEVAIIPKDINLVILSPQVTYYRISDGLNANFLAAQFLNNRFQQLLRKEAIQSTRAYIGITRQKKLPLILPSLNLQNQFAKRIQAIETQKQLAQVSLQKSEDLFNSLLQRAFKGELTA